MCRSAVPLLHEVIPVMDMLVDQLEDFIQRGDVQPIIRAAAARARTVILKYYNKTDDIAMYRIAMVLHPRFKTAYFRSRDWETSWIEDAISLVTTEWELHYKPKLAPPPAVPSEKVCVYHKCLFLVSLLTYSCARGQIHSPQRASSDWQRLKIRSLCTCPVRPSTILRILWPTGMLSSMPLASLSPRKVPLHKWLLILLAVRVCYIDISFLDDLLICYLATSADVERMFSHAGLTLTKHRNSLSDTSVRASVILGNWFKAGLVPVEDLVKIFNDKATRIDSAEGDSLKVKKGKAKARAVDTVIID